MVFFPVLLKLKQEDVLVQITSGSCIYTLSVFAPCSCDRVSFNTEKNHRETIHTILTYGCDFCVGFACFRAFLENVNQNDHRLKKTGNTYTVEKMDLVGLDYLWRVVLEVPSEEIAMLAVKQLMELSYTWLSSKLKKVHVYSLYVSSAYG